MDLGLDSPATRSTVSTPGMKKIVPRKYYTPGRRKIVLCKYITILVEEKLCCMNK